MLTPRFKITQDNDRVFIIIHAPFAHIANTEVDVDGKNVLFTSNPYFLRLSLPGEIIEDDNAKGNYVCDTGEFHFTFTKVTPGETFENLDMITNLLSPRDIPNINPSLVEALEEDGITLDTESSSPCNDTEIFSYGFGNKIDKEFTNIGCEFPQIFELQSPENVLLDKRHELRIDLENDKFSSDHYLADYFDEEALLEPFLSYEPFWDCNNYDYDSEFTMEQVNILKELPNKHYLLTETEYKSILLGLIDILFGYCYDKRTTLNDSNVESSWTINKLSSTLSWFCNFNDVNQVLIASYRRALIYPMYRNFDLCHKVKKDLTSLLQKGKKLIVKCLIEIHQMFNTSTDARYILNQLYINDYLVFMQKCRSEEISELCQNVLNFDVKKDDLELDLKELEHAAELVQEEESDLANGISSRMALMSVNDRAQVNGIGDSETESSVSLAERFPHGVPQETSEESTSDDSSSSDSSTSDDSSSSDSSSSDDSSDLDSDDTESEKSFQFVGR